MQVFWETELLWVQILLVIVVINETVSLNSIKFGSKILYLSQREVEYRHVNQVYSESVVESDALVRKDLQ